MRAHRIWVVPQARPKLEDWEKVKQRLTDLLRKYLEKIIKCL